MRNFINSILSMALISAVCMFFVACEPKPGPEPPEPVKVTGVSVSPETHELEIDRKYTLTATVTPADAENKTVTWSSNKPEIATVNATTGEVTAIKAGEVTITATTQDGGLTDDCALTVTPEELPFTVYSSGSLDRPIHWTVLPEQEYNILVINSDEEMGQYVEGEYPSLNFSELTLILVYGYHPSFVSAGHKFRRLSGNDYEMIGVLRGWTGGPITWHIAFLVDKLPAGSEVELTTIIQWL